ncbi:hypothetical protein FPV16_23515 [Methylobacterium sp. W2]|uniref:hypothetical protein n=1 Tax=Methylobacterium sp. W2 TaxID=2598107 RepID=UPI001D0CB148|nr:hypothetical protein [Methylobacterium sp. W2]MCC0809130.1 hypothetical protein [Methylobacterium sp. W2]
MVDRREKLVASKPAALAAKDAFTSRYVAGHPDLSVGLGLNRTGDGWAMKVFAQTQSAAREIPESFGEFAVEVQITGSATAT